MGPWFKKGLLVSGLVLLADQLSKVWILYGLKLPEVRQIEILPFLSFTMVWNKGISMGLPVDEAVGRWGIIVLTSAISLLILRWLYKSVDKAEALGFALILGGAVGNIIDRFIHGAVADFVHLHAWGYDFYVFNVADSGVTIGVAILLIDGLLLKGKSPKNDAK